MDKISIIIPMYNAEKHIERCVKSILNQTYSQYEIIIINDGSTDNSKIICEKLIEENNSIKLINIENSGVSFARNIGIDNAIGRYFLFIDSDDWIEPDTLEVAYNTIISNESDIVIFGFVYDRYKKNALIKSEIKSVLYNENFAVDEMNKNFRYLYNTIDFSSSCNKLFDSQIIKNNKIKFNEENIIFEDLCFNLKYLKLCDKISIIKEVFYHYTSNEEVNHLSKRNKDITEDVIIAANSLIGFCKYINLDKDEQVEIYSYLQTIFNLALKNIKFKKNSFLIKIKSIKKLSESSIYNAVLKYYSDNPFNKLQLIFFEKKMYYFSYLLIKSKIK